MTETERRAERLALAALDSATKITSAALGAGGEVEFEDTAQEFFVQVFEKALTCLRKATVTPT